MTTNSDDQVPTEAARADKLLTNFFRLNPAFVDAVRRFQQIGDHLAQAAKVVRDFQTFNYKIDLSNLQKNAFAWLDALREKFKGAKQAQALLDAGWVPYAGMPLDDLADDAGIDDIGAFMAHLLDDKWAEVRHQLTETVNASGVDREAVETFEEALGSFEHGRHRSVVRVLFPEIERVARVNLYGPDSEKLAIAGMKDLREALMNGLPAGLAVHANFGFVLTEKMVNHLYREAKTPKGIAILRADPVPSRHATIHGVIDYSSRQNAYNAICMTAFMFDTIMRVRGFAAQNAHDHSWQETHVAHLPR